VIAGIRSEWLKLRTTAVPWVLSGIALLLTGLGILAIFLGGDNTNQGPLATTGDNVPHTAQQLKNLVGAGLSSGYLMALLLGALCVTTEFRHKTVTTSFLVEPRRARLIASKLLTIAILSALLAVLLLIVTVVAGGLTLAALGGSFSDLVHQIPSVAPGMILVFALFGILGVGVGSVLTNQVAAIIVCLGWFLVLELIIEALVNSTARWFPSGAATAAANVSRGRGSDFGLFHWWQGTLLMLLYGLAFATIGSIIIARRDVT
jgi:ABC-2 type transport system permease protein